MPCIISRRSDASTQRQPTNVESVFSGVGNFKDEVSSSTTTGSTSSSARAPDRRGGLRAVQGQACSQGGARSAGAQPVAAPAPTPREASN
eukprot:4546920-Prymnesium_polylepis.1